MPTFPLPVTLFYRKKLPHFHSIETLFSSLTGYLSQHRDLVQVRSEICPHDLSSPFNLVKNLAFAYRNLHPNQINHITGDVHYLAFVLPTRSTILTIHDCVLLDRYPKWHPKYWLFYWFWYKLPARCAAVVTTISEKSKLELIEQVGIRPEKIRVIPNFYDPAFDDDGAVSFRRRRQKPVILHVGTSEHKNLLRVIEAIKDMPCCLQVIGHMSVAQHQKLEEYGIDYQNCFNIGKLELIQKYREADVVVFASTYEGFGMPIIEAQALGRPVITSNLSPMREVAGEGACLVNPYHVADIREAIHRVLNDSAYAQALVAGGHRNKKRFLLQTVAHQYMSLYASINQGALVSS
ncbi:hypothetical protein GCM10023189_31810 [Nibrella saemangeumensis]|uniref:Uncharacterized protein n=1 Tax=Nibrella saemangeumensis TaxID=1084526 RepID=A0ABP8MZS6_9BACT